VVYDFQSLIFRSASHWSAATALAVFAIGLLYLLQGYRFGRYLLPVSCAGGGLVLGGIVADLTGLSLWIALLAAAILGFAALARYRVALAIASILTAGALAQYMAVQLGIRHNVVGVIAIVGGVLGFPMIWVCRRSLPILLTIVQGGGLLVVSFVGVSVALAPSLGLTFIDWSARIPLLVPGLMLMLCVLGYSVQANAVQGSIETGGDPGVRDLKTS
jgi:hypothetical protein